MKIRDIIWHSDTAGGRIFDWCIILLIILSLVTLTVSTLPDLPPALETFLSFCENAILWLFTIEYILRIATAPDKKKYGFSFYGIIDLLCVLPSWVFMAAGAEFDLRVLRTIRLFRVLRLLKLSRYNDTMERFGKALSYSKHELLVFLCATIMLLYLSSVGIYYCENSAQPEAFKSVFHSMWWAVATLSTVGYGDIYPVTTGGKVFTFLILMVGLGLVAVPAGIVSAALQKVLEEENR